jgi:hypothetical protein
MITHSEKEVDESLEKMYSVIPMHLYTHSPIALRVLSSAAQVLHPYIGSLANGCSDPMYTAKIFKLGHVHGSM